MMELHQSQFSQLAPRSAIPAFTLQQLEKELQSLEEYRTSMEEVIQGYDKAIKLLT